MALMLRNSALVAFRFHDGELRGTWAPPAGSARKEGTERLRIVGLASSFEDRLHRVSAAKSDSFACFTPTSHRRQTIDDRRHSSREIEYTNRLPSVRNGIEGLGELLGDRVDDCKCRLASGRVKLREYKFEARPKWKVGICVAHEHAACGAGPFIWQAGTDDLNCCGGDGTVDEQVPVPKWHFIFA